MNKITGGFNMNKTKKVKQSKQKVVQKVFVITMLVMTLSSVVLSLLVQLV